jgi:hypothetical protein
MEKDFALIAEFMGFEKVSVGYFGVSQGGGVLEPETEWQRTHGDWMDKNDMESVGDYIVDVPNNKWFEWEEVRYNSSWDWLMPVVAKITKTNPMNQAWYDVKYPLTEGNIKIVYDRVVSFIKWYDQAKGTV